MTRAVYASNSEAVNDGQAIYVKNWIIVNAAYSHPLSTGFIGWDNRTVVDKAAAAIDVTVYGQNLVILNVHGCWSKCADSQADVDTTGYSVQREAQLTELLSWANLTFPGKRKIYGGDFNLTDQFLKHGGGYQIDLMLAENVNLWAQGVSSGYAVLNWLDLDNDGLPDMDFMQPRSADRRLIDFFFASTNSGLTFSRVEILDGRTPCPHPLVFDGGSLPSCSPEVVQQWDIREDYGVRKTDHNLLFLEITF